MATESREQHAGAPVGQRVSAKIHDFTRQIDYLIRHRPDLSATFIALHSGVSCGDVLAVHSFRDVDRLKSYVVDDIRYDPEHESDLHLFVARVHYERGLVIEGNDGLELRREPDHQLVRARKLAASCAMGAELDSVEFERLLVWVSRSTARTIERRAYIRRTHPTARNIEAAIKAPEGRLGCVWDGRPDVDLAALAEDVATDLGIERGVAGRLCKLAMRGSRP